MKMMNKVCALVLSVALCAGMAAPAFAYFSEAQSLWPNAIYRIKLVWI